jgi:DNA-binding protein Fis
MERAVVLSGGGSITVDMVRPSHRADWTRAGLRRPRQGDLPALIQQMVQTALQTLPVAEPSDLHERVIKGVERELIEQVLIQCNGTHVAAAKRLGINRNTLAAKVEQFSRDAALKRG